jgi:hypothetical protein
MLEKKRRAPNPHEAAFDEIDRWRQWFVDGHAQRLRDDGLDGEDFTRAFAQIQRQADAIREQMKREHITWTAR